MSRIDIKDIRPGDIVLFKGQGLLYEVLSRLLKCFNPSWDRWAWHTGFIAYDDEGWIVCEALANGVCLNPLNGRDARFYRWFDIEPPGDQIIKFIREHINDQYDVLLYFWTTVAYIVRHFWNKPIPRLLDNRWTCWELVTFFCDRMGKPIISIFDCPILTDMIKALEAK